MAIKAQPRFVEIAPGEIRHLCLACDTPLRERRALYCAEHKNHKVNVCESCGKATGGVICLECRIAAAEGKPIPARRSQIRGGKRELTELDRPLVEKWWAEEVPTKEIAKRLGLSTKQPAKTIGYKRGKGWNLPYRKPWSVEHAKQMARERREAHELSSL